MSKIDDIYIEMNSLISKEIKTPKDLFNKDLILIEIIANWGIAFIQKDFFLTSLSKILAEYKIPHCSVVDIQEYVNLKLLYLNNISYLKSDVEKFHGCEKYILGQYLFIKSSTYHQLFNVLECKDEDRFEEAGVQVLKLNYSSNTFYVTINYILLLMQEQAANKISKYYDGVNHYLMIDAKQTIDQYLSCKHNISSELIEMVGNYINDYLSVFLLDKRNFIAFEYLISIRNLFTRMVLDSNTDDQKITMSGIKDGSKLKESIFLQRDNFQKLIRIVGKKINLPNKFHSSIVWILIRQITISYFAQVWEKEYGIYLNGTDDVIALEDFINLFCECIDIPHKNLRVIGLFTYYLMNKLLFDPEINSNYLKCFDTIKTEVFNKIDEIEFNILERKLSQKTNSQVALTYSINDIDLMDGYEFEEFVSILFTRMGYDTVVTKGSGDQGLDVLAEKNGAKIGIQAKCYSSNVTNKAVQEISAALKHYNCSKGIVVTNSYYTDSAIELAKSNNIVLWDRDFLKRKIEEVFAK